MESEEEEVTDYNDDADENSDNTLSPTTIPQIPLKINYFIEKHIKSFLHYFKSRFWH